MTLLGRNATDARKQKRGNQPHLSEVLPRQSNPNAPAVKYARRHGFVCRK